MQNRTSEHLKDNVSEVTQLEGGRTPQSSLSTHSDLFPPGTVASLSRDGPGCYQPHTCLSDAAGCSWEHLSHSFCPQLKQKTAGLRLAQNPLHVCLTRH